MEFSPYGAVDRISPINSAQNFLCMHYLDFVLLIKKYQKFLIMNILSHEI